jgi:hypothetical protein
LGVISPSYVGFSAADSQILQPIDCQRNIFSAQYVSDCRQHLKRDVEMLELITVCGKHRVIVRKILTQRFK